MRNILLLLIWFYSSISFSPVDGFAVPNGLQTRRIQQCASQLGATPFGVLVEAEIDPDRMGEFIKMIENNAVETRKEPGCIRFDVLRSQDANNKFYFYELYKSEEAVDFHKTQPHYEAWAKFKESGGTVSSASHKMDVIANVLSNRVYSYILNFLGVTPPIMLS